MADVADHPRHRFTLKSVQSQASAFEDALRRGRLHHAWLLTGPEGLGKASFAYRAARNLLGAKPDEAFGPLGAAPDDLVCRMIAAQSHPDLLVLERSGEGARRMIAVDEARRLPEFFAKAPALGPYRVAIIDAVDDFNTNGANAVLKTLEEPSGRGVLLLISHAPGRLLPTIRSRCRTLAFRPWTEGAVAGMLQDGPYAEDAVDIASMAGGSPGRAIALAGAKAVTLDQMAREMVSGAAVVPAAGLMTLAESFRGGEGRNDLRSFSVVFQTRCNAEPQALAAQAARWAVLWDRLSGLAGRVEGLNLDRADAFWSLVSEIETAARF